MEDLMVTVKMPRYLVYDLFGSGIKCLSSDFEIMKCSLCRFYGSVRCVNVKFKDSMLCEEEEEVTTAVAGVGKSSCRDSETLHPDGSERSGVLNP